MEVKSDAESAAETVQIPRMQGLLRNRDVLSGAHGESAGQHAHEQP